jgi:hypothetical protein
MLSLLVWVAGCSDSPTVTDQDQTISLEGDFGGLTTTKEAPAFGDTELAADDITEEEIDDPVLSSPEVASLVDDIDAGMFHFRAVWGQLCLDTTVTEVTDWTGSITISRGAVVIRKTIRFELGQDYIPTRTDRQTVDWVSYTTVHNDGVAFDLLVPPVEPIYDTTVTVGTDSLGNPVDVITVDTIYPETEPVTVEFATGAYMRVFTLDELAALDTIVELDDGNAVAIHAAQVFCQRCPRGFLAGGWGYDEEGQGVFRGRWMSREGRIVGHLRGHFGVNDAGRNVIFGKWIDRSGNCEGLLAGTYQPFLRPDASDIANRRGCGWFAMRIFDANRAPIGMAAGQYQSAAAMPVGTNLLWTMGWMRICSLHRTCLAHKEGRPHSVVGLSISHKIQKSLILVAVRHS